MRLGEKKKMWLRRFHLVNHDHMGVMEQEISECFPIRPHVRVDAAVWAAVIISLKENQRTNVM